MVMILPDENGKLPDNKRCQYPYDKQLEMIEFVKATYLEGTTNV